MNPLGAPGRRPVPEEEAELLVGAATAHPLGPAIQEFLEKNGFSRVALFGVVADAWQETVGEDVLAHCQPLRLDGDQLVVQVDHQGWITELAFRQQAILSALEQRLGVLVVAQLKVTLTRRSDVE